MIIEMALSPFFALIHLIISLIPSCEVANGTASESFYHLVGLGLYFVGTKNFVLVLGSVIFWSTVQLTWGVIEWIYKKIPGVN